ncbi:hypothetical protein A2995_00010 [Candidatus Nomurabacteria bacterium RIFCSPLOWO2_01_FULL_33_24]|uniref:Uncharacterized protein n=1 Tax=Candidatus Nomurabacteria bacterium RIFCSPLOWO2_01_FULL_33_24 TaxID=1801765 RepID=A0A1F6X320_9BACT|nr:MAG: hypothetical protein A2995_00010 [Candidatus Nomurabacteria bacterium RIFCSPLOWO2_01_FULL_33_24]
MIKIGDYNKIMSDRNLFNQIVYTPLSDAIKLFNERQKDPKLMAKVKKLLNRNIPKVFKDKKCGIMARQLATPNYENRRFISLVKENGLHPVFIEYFDDKFTSNNKYKHSLGQLHIQNKIDKNGKECVEKITIIDFNKSNGKKLKDIKTLWGESLIDFHKKLFDLYNINDVSFLNEIDWYEKKNEKPIDFYVNFFLLITCFGILFENFLALKGDTEAKFTKDVVLPALEKVINLTGVKPLIVPLEPIDIETDNFWYYHLPIVKKLIK